MTYCDRNGNPIIESKVSSWNRTADCCSWEGVTCDEFTGQVTELDLSASRLTGVIDSNSSIFQLPHLQRLNLAYNFLEGSNFSTEFRRFTHLSHLNLTRSGFGGQVPTEISQLNELVSLDLSENQLNLHSHVFKALLQNMTRLRELYLQNVLITSSIPNNLSSSQGHRSQSFNGPISPGILNLEHLTVLDMKGNNIDVSIPNFASNNLKRLKVLLLPENKLTTAGVSSFVSNLTQLETIDLSDCPLYVIPHEFFKLSLLQWINLENTLLSGSIPKLFSNFVKLEYLNLGTNNFNGPIETEALSHLANLKYLNLRTNNFNGPIEAEALSHLVNLKFLNLASNNFTGPVGKALSNLVNLRYLDLGFNRFSGHIETATLSKLRNLQFPNLGSNNFSGPIKADTFSNHVNLTMLDLSSNNFHSTLDVKFLSGLKWMDKLDLSFNNLSLINEDNTTILPTISIKSLRLAYCNIRDLDVLRSIGGVEDLYLPNNNIRGEIPDWVWSNWSNVTTLDLSNNFITHIGSIIHLHSLLELNLRSNLFQGQLPLLPLGTESVFLSNNQLHGEIKPSICQLRILNVLDLSNNSFNGSLPPCIGMMANGLKVLDLHMNNLHGIIPDTFSLTYLRNLNLRGNHFEGEVPHSLINCSDLGVLDLSENNLNGTFPIWLGALPNLLVLSLRSNKFYGPISSIHATANAFSHLQILDLSFNQLSGSLPAKFFHRLWKMMSIDVTSRNFTYYGDQYEYRGMLNGNMIQLDLSNDVVLIDLSCNNLEGEIPNAIGDLMAMQWLNLSHNYFTGQIPPELGKLSNLHWLDLSSNKLYGNIPNELSALGFLAVMNLSYNHLTGQIPSGRQLQTFSNDSYMGNDGLCGYPLSKTCGNHIPSMTQSPHPSLPDEEDHQEFFDGFTWQSVLVGYGVGICVGLVIGTVMLFNEKPKWLIRIIKEEAHRIGYKYKSRNGISFTWNRRHN